MQIYEVLLSTIYRLKGDNRYKYYKNLKGHLNLNRSELVHVQEKNIQKLIHHAYYNTDYYRELMDLHQIKPEEIKTRNDLKRIPILTKKIIKDNIEKFKSTDDFGNNLTKVTSGGSTGELGIIYASKLYVEMCKGSWLRNNSMIGWMPWDKTAWIWGTSFNEKNNLMHKLNLFISRKIVFNANNYSKKDFKKWYFETLKFKPKVLFGYSNIIYEFSKFILENKLKLPSIKMVVSTSEKLENRKIIETAFSCHVYDQYGCRESSAIAIEVSSGNMLFTDDVVIVNTTSNHEFLLTPLFSFGFPLINYKVGDIGEIKNELEITNKFPFPNSKLLIGRMSDYFLLETDKRISHIAFSSSLNPLTLGVKEHQIIQKNYKHFVINFVHHEKTIIEEYYKKTSINLEKFFGENLKITFNKVSRIPVEKSGKLLLYKRTFKLGV